jgi:hypothetical protein
MLARNLTSDQSHMLDPRAQEASDSLPQLEKPRSGLQLRLLRVTKTIKKDATLISAIQLLLVAKTSEAALLLFSSFAF